jgi:hypothetical protein
VIAELLVRVAKVQIQRRVEAANALVPHRIGVLQRHLVPPKGLLRTVLMPGEVVGGNAGVVVVGALGPSSLEQAPGNVVAALVFRLHAASAQLDHWVIGIHVHTRLLRTDWQQRRGGGRQSDAAACRRESAKGGATCSRL